MTAQPVSIVPDKAEYYKILSPDFPEFITKYLNLPILSRLAGIGLLCGTDWTPLYHNRFYYSRLDHSTGVALIIWHFTHNKAQTIAGLLHDVSTPVFSHVTDFRNGDALTQESTENANSMMIKNDKFLAELLIKDNLTAESVSDYHNYPVADNEVPQLSADRLEYMFPSGMVLEGSWNIADIKNAYSDLVLCRNETGTCEIGFKTQAIAEDYCRRFCNTGHVLQLNENKLTLQLLAELLNAAVALKIIQEHDCYAMSEQHIIAVFESESKLRPDTRFASLFRTFRSMTSIKHTDEPIPGYFCVSLKVKQRYINPLVVCGNKKSGLFPARRLKDISPYADGIISDFLAYSDTPYGCVKLI